MTAAASSEWSNVFFDVPQLNSTDGGTTTAGPLWHAASTRWGHSMHAMCSYHGMFPAKLAHYFIQRYSKPGDLVVDPFSGRGTVPLQARAEGRRTISNDLNPLAYVLSRAKAAPPSWTSVTRVLNKLHEDYRTAEWGEPDVPDDIRMLYHPATLKQLCYLRAYLHRHSLREWSKEDLMIGGALAGIMHGSHRRDGTSQYLSISMPNTFSMSPSYVAKYISEKNLVAPDQDVFDRVYDKLARLYLDAISGPNGDTHSMDAAQLLTPTGKVKRGSTALVLTSPPYLQVVNYGTANWIRLWLLGVDEVGRERGTGRKRLNQVLDHRHTYTSYMDFMLRVFVGIERVLARTGTAVVVIGDVVQPGKDRVPLAERLWQDVGDRTGLRLLRMVEDQLPVEKKVSRIWGDTKGQATDKDCILVLGRNDAYGLEDYETDWDEPYKDGGPDAAHARVKAIRSQD